MGDAVADRVPVTVPDMDSEVVRVMVLEGVTEGVAL